VHDYPVEKGRELSLVKLGETKLNNTSEERMFSIMGLAQIGESRRR